MHDRHVHKTSLHKPECFLSLFAELPQWPAVCVTSQWPHTEIMRGAPSATVPEASWDQGMETRHVLSADVPPISSRFLAYSDALSVLYLQFLVHCAAVR